MSLLWLLPAVIVAAALGGGLRHVMASATARGLDAANLLGCAIAGVAVGRGITGDAATVLVMAGCGSLTSLSAVVVDVRSVRAAAGAAARIAVGVAVVATAAMVAG